jgi:hypothetical protein
MMAVEPTPKTLITETPAGPLGLSSTPMVVYPSQAFRWVLHHRYPRQRALRDSFVAQLKAAIRAGTFKPGTVEFHCLPDGQEYLTDGQHRLTAIAEAGVPVEMVVLRRWVPTMAEVDAAYAATDRGRMRTYADVYRAQDLAAEFDLTAQDTTYLGVAVVHILADFAPVGARPLVMDNARRVAAMREWQVPARALCLRTYQGIPGGWRRRLLRSVPFAIALVTMRYQDIIAQGFWGSVARQEHLRLGYPEHTLAQLLGETTVRRFGGKDHVLARTIAAMWNAAFEGRQWPRIVPPKDPTRPIRLLGTPYDGKSAYGPEED